jgi:hypothetical protein
MKLHKILLEQERGWRVLHGAEADKDEYVGARVGTLDDTTYDELVAILGEPTEKNVGDDFDKCAVKWVILGNDGTVCRIYDYKQSTQYTGDEDLEFSNLHDDEDVARELEMKQHGRSQTEAERLGVSRVNSWSIGGGANDIEKRLHDRFGQRMTAGVAVELAKKIFGDKAVHSIFEKPFRDMFNS